MRVNCVSAGLLDTGAGDDYYGGPEGPGQRVAATVPLGRMGTPADVAQACLFLASPAAGSYVRGQPGAPRRGRVARFYAARPVGRERDLAAASNPASKPVPSPVSAGP